MPRTLSGLKTGDFDTLEVADKFEAKGEMIHSGETPPEFQHLKVGTNAPDIPEGSNIALSVGGSIPQNLLTKCIIKISIS